MSNELKTFDYKGTPITFQSGNGVMVNATQMAKRFGKRVPEWTRLPSTKEFLDRLWAIRKHDESTEVQKMHYAIEQVDDEGLDHIFKCFDRDLHLVVTKTGGNNQGTWMHEDVAMEFARWLNPDFAIWCNDRIKELLTQGHTELQNEQMLLLSKALLIAKDQMDAQLKTIEEQANTINTKTQVLEETRMIIREQANQLQAKDESIRQLTPLVDYTREVLQSTSTFTLTEIAKDLGFRSVYAFTKWAHENGILYRQSDRWMPTAKVSGKGYFSTRTSKFVRHDDTIGTSISTVVTEQGRAFLHNVIAKKGGCVAL